MLTLHSLETGPVMVHPLTFPLFERALERGVLEGQSALSIDHWAPTATGKSFIGREAVPGEHF
jgi:hypothetical protein